ncbi:MAG: hypothetical protein GF364_06885 [Candidatus Lokiarchaeota archaeon]|nr:hypothetical protein [Candidatus Lokiarchaeota archaeon]
MYALNQNHKKTIYIPPDGIIITPSGMRGEFGKVLTLEVILRFTKSYGLWMGKNSEVIVGRDTRNSSIIISNVIISALNAVGIDVIDVGVCPTPAILHYKRKHNIDGAAIISGSHNPPKDNGIKFLSRTHTFLGKKELNEINEFFLYKDDLSAENWQDLGTINEREIIADYLNALKEELNTDIFSSNKLKVVIDPGAGAGTNVTSKILKSLHCNVFEINEKFIDYPNFPRPIEPIKPHLDKLSEEIQKRKADVGFAHDCDADRVALVGATGKVYPEDIIIILVIRYILQRHAESENPAKIIIVTNSASSLMFEKVAEQFNAEIIRTPVGERHLATKMNNLIDDNPGLLIFGGEGSSGGLMYPRFNNARDGIFAACLVCELLCYYQKSIDELVEELPRFFTTRIKIKTAGLAVNEVLAKIKQNLSEKKVEYEIIDRDIKILNMENEEWTLIHPSNTEPVIRIITEARIKKRADTLCGKMSELIKNYI